MQFSSGWLSFELGVLRRLKFSSVALPFTGEPDLGVRLKNWGVRVAANDPMIWSYTKALALIENRGEQLSKEELGILLDNAYVPRDNFNNPALLNWFNEIDAWWLDNLRFNAEQLEPYKRALALTAGMMVGDYILSFNDLTRSLREPFALPKVFRLVLKSLPPNRDNAVRNLSANQDVRNFVAERHHTELMLLRLPVPIPQNGGGKDRFTTWREEWLRGRDDFWLELRKERGAQLGSRVQSKQQYLGFVEDLLRTASHIPTWAIAHTENGFITTDELVEKVSRVRKVASIYSKDFSDLLGVRASILVATS